MLLFFKDMGDFFVNDSYPFCFYHLIRVKKGAVRIVSLLRNLAHFLQSN